LEKQRAKEVAAAKTERKEERARIREGKKAAKAKRRDEERGEDGG